MDKPVVILAVPYMFGVDQCLEHNLQFCGYEVINLCFDNRDSYYPNLFSRLKAFYFKNVKRSNDYKKELKYSRFQTQINEKIAQLKGKKAAFALCIDAHIYPHSVMQKIREYSDICINYQWDGVGRFPEVLDYAQYFDRFLVFNHDDVVCYPQYQFEKGTNFYFDYPLNNSQQESGVYFLGGYEERRIEATQCFLQEANRLNLPIDFYIYCKDDRAKKVFGDKGITYLTRETELNFEQNLEKIKSCQVVVDFVQFDNYGLSFRVFEALGFDKKLITTNQTVKNYDFYHPDNIFVWDGKNLDGLSNFLGQPYKPLLPEIKQYYAFSSWWQRAIKGLVE